jgi:carbon-monoxide dehydrogenase medium subunit
MIPGEFSYHRPKSIGEAAALLASLGNEARPLAGGHSLIPMMKMRMATPEHLIDLAGIAELKGICQQGGEIVIGAMTTQAEMIGSDLLAAQAPIIRETSLVIADPQIRYCGTLGGNVANGDPGNDMPAVMIALNARYTAVGEQGERVIPAREFYQGAYYTALEPGEFIVSVTIPAQSPGHGFAYEKMKRKVGDYATAAAAAIVTKREGVIATCALGLTNVGDTALFAEEAASAVIGSRLDAASLTRAKAAAEAITSPATDGRGTAAYRTKIAGVMVERALRRAFERA